MRGLNSYLKRFFMIRMICALTAVVLIGIVAFHTETPVSVEVKETKVSCSCCCCGCAATGICTCEECKGCAFCAKEAGNAKLEKDSKK